MVSHAHGLAILGAQENYDIQPIQKALNGVFNKRDGNMLIKRDVPASVAADLAQQAVKMIDRALKARPDGWFVADSVELATRQKAVKAEADALLKEAKKLPASASFPNPERVRESLIKAVSEYNAALASNEDFKERVTFLRGFKERIEELVTLLDKGIREVESANWKPWIIAAGVLAGLGAVAVVAWKGADIVKLLKPKAN